MLIPYFFLCNDPTLFIGTETQILVKAGISVLPLPVTISPVTELIHSILLQKGSMWEAQILLPKQAPSRGFSFTVSSLPPPLGLLALSVRVC